MSTPLEIAVTTREALRANADALNPVIEELARHAAREIATAHGDAWEIAIYAENEGAFYSSDVKPAIRATAHRAGGRLEWLNVARGAVQLFRKTFCDKAWHPTPGTLETIAAYFETVKYAADIEACRNGEAFK